jgi:hypothetical protein
MKSTTVCRSSAGVCDLVESCDGVGNACPADMKSTAVCRSAAGVCDAAESCDGGADACPADALLPSGTVCRSSTGSCDLAESCTGSSAACPADTGLPDTDLDTVCDAPDNCPTVANTDQANGDADSLGDECDPCTNGGVAIKQKITITKILAPTGDDKLTFVGQSTLANLSTPPLDPVMNGVRVLIVDNVGAVVLDTTVDPGAYDTVTKIGWKVNGSATSWTYKNPGSHPQKIILVGVKKVPSVPGLVKFKVKGKNGSYQVNTANLPLHATLILDPPTAATGECVEATWPATPPAKPSCLTASSGATVKCK